MFYEPVRLRTLARFSAVDPWMTNLLTDYSIEEYVMMPLGSSRPVDSKWSMHSIGIQWENQSRYRLLPESLVELWKLGRIGTDKLPWLLHALEPKLDETDCMLSQSWQRAWGIPMLMLLLVCPAVFLVIHVHGERMPALAAILSGLLIALLSGLTLWMIRSTKRARVQEQMKWVLSQISEQRAAEPAASMDGSFNVFFKLSLKVFLIFMALMALGLCGGVVYWKVHE